MPAELEIRDGKAQMFYALSHGVPWHGAGTSVAEAVVAKEATKIAGLDWTTSVEPIFGPDGRELDRFSGIVRDIDQAVLGVVRRNGRYEPIQNAEAVEFLDSLVADRELRYNTAGSLYGGSVVWYLAEMPSDVRVGDDEYEQYLLATTSHDGTRSLAVYATSVRVVCANTWMAATAKSALARIRHSRTKVRQMDEAREIIKATTLEQRRFTEWLQRLNEERVSREQAIEFQTELFGSYDEKTSAARAKAIEAWQDIYLEEVDRVGRTGYALLNTVTGYADHAIKFDEDAGDRFASILQGRASMFKRDGLKAVERITGIAPVAVA